MMQTTREREVPAEARPQVHKMAVTNRWLIAAVVVFLLAVVGLGVYATVQATADEGEDVLIRGRDELSARQEQMVDVVERWWAAAEAADVGALTALMTPDATVSGATSWAVTKRVDDGSFASLVEEYWTEAELTPKLATLVIGDTVVTAGHDNGSSERAPSAPGECSDSHATPMGYHMVMARREVLVQLDDQLVAQLDELADRLGTSRSELLRRGAQAVITAEELAAADRELVRAYRRQPPDPLVVQAARNLAARTAPAW